jgi:hypothetical protein
MATPLYAWLTRALAGKRFFEELDRDNDGRVKVDDLKICMRCALYAA